MPDITDTQAEPQRGEEERLAQEPPGARRGAPCAEDAGEGAQSRIEQVGSIVSKGLDLIEAAVTLGVNLATRFSSVVQQEVAERTNRSGEAYEVPVAAPAYGGPEVGGSESQRQVPATAPTAQSLPPEYYVVNRTPLFPGSPVRVSFTINNDSLSSPRRIRLRVEGFTGETRGAALDGQSFAVKPASKVVAPMDFDKFTLTGAIPPDALFDIYQGWVVVAEEQEFRIPVRLLVSEPPA